MVKQPTTTHSELRLGRPVQQPDGGEGLQAGQLRRAVLPPGTHTRVHVPMYVCVGVTVLAYMCAYMCAWMCVAVLLGERTKHTCAYMHTHTKLGACAWAVK